MKYSKSGISIGVVIAVLMAIAYGVWRWDSRPTAHVGILNVYEGSGTIMRGGALIPGETGTVLQAGDTVVTDEQSRISVILDDGSVIRLAPGTTFGMQDIAYGADGKITAFGAEVREGKAWAHVVGMGPGGSFRVETPVVVAVVRGTALDVEYENGMSRVYLGAHEAEAYLKNSPAETKIVGEGMEIVIRDGFEEEDFGKEPASPEEKDPWIIMNEAEDARWEGEVSPAPVGTAAPAPVEPVPAPRPTPPSSAPALPRESAPVREPSAPVPRIVTKLIANAYRTEIAEGETVPLEAIGEYPDGTAGDESRQVTWTQDPVLGVIGANADFRAIRAGTTVIRAHLGEAVSNDIVLRVVPALSADATGR